MNLSRWLRPKEHRFGLETLEIAGPLQFTRAGCFAWYLLGAESWDFLALPARVRLWDQQAFRWGRLAETSSAEGRMVRMRVTTRPYPSFEFARSLDEHTASPLPQVDGRRVVGRLSRVRAAPAPLDRVGLQGGRGRAVVGAVPAAEGP